ncbi:hypothetical protein [Spirosoma sp.]|uniref:hypothetical protein n=1 Tax=Spirosoma sp. TaxID=1899569 RepID=UPI003B3A6BDE
MEPNLLLTRLGPRIKLFRRHIREWTDLLIHQRQLRQLTRAELNNKLSSLSDSQRIIERTRQANRLAQLDIRQAQERQRLQFRQQQEERNLEEVLKPGQA